MSSRIVDYEIEPAFSPDEFINDRPCFVFASGLKEVAAKIEGITRQEPA